MAGFRDGARPAARGWARPARRAPLVAAAALACAAPWAFDHIVRAFSVATTRPHATRTRLRATADLSDPTLDPWKTLGIPVDSEDGMVKKAYKKLIIQFHPDLDPSEGAAARLQEIVEAYEILTGENDSVDMGTMLRNAVLNLEDELEDRKKELEGWLEEMSLPAERRTQRLSELKKTSSMVEEELKRVEEYLEKARKKSDEVDRGDNAVGAALLGFAAGGPVGAVLGAIGGYSIKNSDTAVGKVVKGAGRVGRGLSKVVGDRVGKQAGEAKT